MIFSTSFSKPFFSTLFLVFFFFGARAQENNLLWKITGKGIKKPSYLMGTIHLKERRLFSFPDSVYTAMQNTDGFAMEILPDSLLSDIVNGSKKSNTKEDTNNTPEKLLTPEELKKLDKRLRKQLGISIKHLSGSRAWFISSLLNRDVDRADDLPTFMDAYLMGISRRTGKDLYSLEKLSDYDAIMSRKGFTREDLLMLIENDIAGKNGYNEQLRQMYLNQNLAEIQNLSLKSDSAFQYNLLYNRNITMAGRIDSLAQLHSIFFTMGSAHLPGNKGVIALLRQRGYTVEPVYCEHRTPIEEVSFKFQEAGWHDYESEVFSYKVQLPGKPVNQDLASGNASNLLFYCDLGTGICYMLGETVSGEDSLDSETESMIDRLSNSYGNSKDSFKQQKLIRDGVPVSEVTLNEESGQKLKIQLFNRSGKATFLMVIAPAVVKIDHEDIERFFNSVHLTTPAPPSWKKYSYDNLGIKLELPLKPMETNTKTTAASEYTKWLSLTSVNNKDSINYIFYGKFLKSTLTSPNDSSVFQSIQSRLEEKPNKLISKQDRIIKKGLAREFYGKLKNSFLRVRVIKYGNQVYTMNAMSPNAIPDTGEVSRWFDSFELETSTPVALSLFEDTMGFSVMVPDSLQLIMSRDNEGEVVNDGGYYDERYSTSSSWVRDWVKMAQDSTNATNYFVARSHANNYFWAEPDSLFSRYMSEWKPMEDDSLVSIKYHYEGFPKYADAVIKRKEDFVPEQFRLIASKNYIYELKCADATIGTKNCLQFFQSFKLKTAEPDSFNIDLSEKLFADLISENDSIADIAKNSIESSGLSFKHTNRMLDVLKHDFPRSDTYLTAPDLLTQKIKEVANSALIPIIRKRYHEVSDWNESLKFPLLEALASIDNKEAYELINGLTEQWLPIENSSYGFFDELEKHPKLTATLYPAFLKHVSEPIVGLAICSLTSSLIDSSAIDSNITKGFQEELKSLALQYLQSKSYTDFENYHRINELIRRIEINNVETENLVKRFLSNPNIEAQISACIALIKAGKAKDKKVTQKLESLAQSIENRVDLYERMKKDSVLAYFPPTWSTQQNLAASRLYTFMTYDNEYQNVVLESIGKKEIIIEDTVKVVYLFKANAKMDNYRVTYLGTSGPYDVDNLILESGDSYTSFYKELLTKENLEELMEKHFKELGNM